jgi:MFS family permease
MVLILMNIVDSATAYPIGWLSDHIPRVWFLLLGFVTLIAADVILGFSTTLMWGSVGILLWGLHLGLSQGVLSALVADSCPKDLRGTAFGIFNFLSAMALLIANPVAGLLWDVAGARTTFTAAALLAVLGGGGLLLSRKTLAGSL